MSQPPTQRVDGQSAAVSGPSASTSTSKPMAPASRRRLTAAGVSIMQAHWDKFPGQMPSPSQRKELLQLIRVISFAIDTDNHRALINRFLQQQVPGCEFYKTVNVVDWFKTRVGKLSNGRIVTPDARFPSLSPATLEHLHVLVRYQRNPSADVVFTWATLLKVKYDDIVTWLRSQGVPQQEARLPTPASTITPASSASPKPAPQAYSSHYRPIKPDPSVSPVLAQSTWTTPPASSSYYRARPVSQLTVSTTTPATSAYPSPLSAVEDTKSWHARAIALEAAIAQGVRDASTKPPTPPIVLPKSAAEFNAMFANHEDTLTQLYQAFKTS